MATAHVGGVRRGVVLEQQHVAHQAGARHRALEQIVAEHAVLGQPPGGGLAEHIHVVDALAHERALVEDVLVEVGDRPRVGIDAGLAGVEAGEARAARARHGDGDERLQDPVALTDTTELDVETRAVERVGHGGGELACRVARQLGVAV